MSAALPPSRQIPATTASGSMFAPVMGRIPPDLVVVVREVAGVVTHVGATSALCSVSVAGVAVGSPVHEGVGVGVRGVGVGVRDGVGVRGFGVTVFMH